MKAAILIIVLSLLGAICYFWLIPFIQIDTCLDAGGAWDYEAETCVYGPAGPNASIFFSAPLSFSVPLIVTPVVRRV